MDFLEGIGFIKIYRNCKNGVNAALISLQRLLNHLGYQNGAKKGMKTYRLME